MSQLPSADGPHDAPLDGPTVDRPTVAAPTVGSHCVAKHAAEPDRSGCSQLDNRRKFIRGSSLLIASALPPAALAAASSTVCSSASVPLRQSPLPAGSTSTGQRGLKLGLVGCGFRGVNVISSLLATQPRGGRWHLTAVADAFPDRMQQALRGLKGKFPQQVAVDSAARCLGLSGYQQLLQRDVDLVILATPPAFRPEHFEAAVAAAKHVYAENPIAVDVAGVRRFQAANVQAEKQGLVVSVGRPRHHRIQFHAALDQLSGGAIGHIVSGRAFQSVYPPLPLAAGKSLAVRESQLRNWMHHQWASGGPWIEPQVHNLDTMNAVFGMHPVAARPADTGLLSENVEVADFCGCGGQSTDGQGHSQPIEYLYASGISLLSYCRLVESPRLAKRVLTVQGTQGQCDLLTGKIFDLQGRLVWRPPQVDSRSEQFGGLLAALGDGSHFNQAATAIEATLTAILGRTANSQGQQVDWAEVA